MQVVKSPRHVLIVTGVGPHIEDKWLGCSVIGFETGGTKTRITFMNWEDKRVDGSVAPLARENMYVDESVVPAPYVSPPPTPPKRSWSACNVNRGVVQVLSMDYDQRSQSAHEENERGAKRQMIAKHGKRAFFPVDGRGPAIPPGYKSIAAATARAKKAQKEKEEAYVAGLVKEIMTSEWFNKDFKSPSRTNILHALLGCYPIVLSENRMKRAIQSVTEYAGYQSYRLKNEG